MSRDSGLGRQMSDVCLVGTWLIQMVDSNLGKKINPSNLSIMKVVSVFFSCIMVQWFDNLSVNQIKYQNISSSKNLESHIISRGRFGPANVHRGFDHTKECHPNTTPTK